MKRNIIYLILLLGLIVRIVGLNQSFWLDEAAQVIESRRPLVEQLNIKADFWPPLYHILLHFWMLANTSEIWIRSLSVTLALISIWFSYKIATKLFNQQVGTLSTLLLALSPFHVWYSQESRPYMLTVALGTAATWFLFEKKWFGYFLALTALFYSTYLAAFLVTAHAVYIWIARKDFSPFVKSVGLSVLLFLPWTPKLLEQLHGGRELVNALPGWSEAVSTPQWKALPLTFAKFILGRVSFSNDYFYGGYVLALFILCIFIFKYAWRGFPKEIKVLSIFIGVPILCAWLLSFWLPIYAPQRLLYILPLFYVVLAAGIFSLKRAWKILLALFFLVSVYSLYLYTQPQFQREQWRQAITYVETDGVKQKSLVLFVFPEAFSPWQWYSQDLVPSLAIAPNIIVSATRLTQDLSRLRENDKIYYFHYLTELTDPQKQVPQFLINLGFTEALIKDFPGVGFISIYEKSVASN